MKTKKNINTISEEELSPYLITNKEIGLTEQQVILRREKFGKNVLVKSKKQSFFVSFIKAIFCEMMSLLLFVTGIIGLGLAIYENIKGTHTYILAYIEAGVLLSIDIINALFGTIQERKSSNAIEELEKMSSPLSKVLREGVIKQIKSSDLVVGDIIIVEAGDTVSADAILFSDYHLKVSESILTGESEPVLKDADFKSSARSPLGEQKNKIFSGTSVLNGKGYGIVYATGNRTEIGKIADSLNNSEMILSPLQLKLQKLGKVLGIFGIILTIITFIFALLIIENVFNTSDVVQSIQRSLLLTISLAAVSLPEGLAAIVTILLSVGVKRMTKNNALIKKLPSVETLGSTSVICSDKTGTLTMNKMTVVKIWKYGDANETSTLVGGVEEDKIDFIMKSALCTDAVIDENPNESKRKVPIGDPTEVAILDLALKNKISVLNIKQKYKRIGEIPFDSDRKLMSSINVIDGRKMLIVKGAPDVIFSKCRNIDPAKAMRINNAWSDRAIRVLAIAQKEITTSIGEDLRPEDFEFDLQFIGLIGMIDPPREEVKVSIKECISAGIKPVMITGDHLNTAKAIAKDLGIITNEQKQLAITGVELDRMSDDELFKNIEKYSVYARVSPENKIRIVKAWQAKDQVVAMTGDGVNDAPALKAADIGCAMGITGTDVSKQASDMILMDDNFSTIVQAVKLGRNIYANIKRIVKFLLSSNVTGVFAIIFGMIIFYLAFEYGSWGKVTADHVIQSIGVNANAQLIADKINANVTFSTTITTILILIHHMVIETFPGVALGAQLTTTNLMDRRPISRYESIFARGLIGQTIIAGLIHGVLSIVAYVIGVQIAIILNAPLLKFYYGIIATFLTLAIGGVLKSIVMCSTTSVLKQKWSECKWVYFTSLISLGIVFFVALPPQIITVCAERPELNFNNMGLSNVISQQQFDKLIYDISGGTNQDDFAHWSIYLTGILLGFVTLLFLEAQKYYENDLSKYSKESKIVIKDFELIKRPKSKYFWK